MRRVLVIIVVVIMFLVFVAHTRNNPKIIINRLIKKATVLSGDFLSSDLRYKIYLLGVVPMGEATLTAVKTEEYRGQKVYHLTATARSLKLFSKFFNGSARLDSYIDMQQFNPVLFKQKIDIAGKQSINKEVVYDQQNGIMTLGGVKRQILPNTHDPLSAVFNIERMDFDKLKDLELNLNTNQKNYILKGPCLPETIVINNKAYKVFVIEAQIKRRDKNPYHQSKITMVLLKDKINIPVLIKVFAGEMFLTARLTDIE